MSGQKRCSIDRFDRDIVRHMLLWGRYGTLHDEDVFPAFGMNVTQFSRRFVQIANCLDTTAFDEVDRDLIDDARAFIAHSATQS